MNNVEEGDVEKLSTCINFPHARVGANGKLRVSEKADALMPPDFFEEFRKCYEWNHISLAQCDKPVLTM